MTRAALFCGGLFALTAAIVPVSAAPLPADPNEGIIADRTGFIPNRKQLPVPGKIIAVLVADAQPILSTERRIGPPDQLCLGWNGGSYRWVYIPVDDKPQFGNLTVTLPEGKSRVYPKLSMASLATVNASGIDSPYSLVEMEVNGGDGSLAGDWLVATKLKKLDGSTEFPIRVAEVVADLKKRFESHLSENQKEIDAAMNAAAKKAIKDRMPTGPREKNTLMFVTWMEKEEKLQVRFLTKMTDGDYKYANGINIELRPAPPPQSAPPQGGAAPPTRLENGLRYGAQFGVELGEQFEVSKDGKIGRMKRLEMQTFQNDLPFPRLGKGKKGKQ
jgi:hypothetical protein